MSKTIKVGFCVSYDWELLKNSLPRVYHYADIICLAVDKDRKSWSGNKYEFDDDAFYSFVKEIDPDNKIIVYEDCFSLPELDARQNCNRHRTLIAEKMGKGGWHIQVDSDEYFLNFKGFVDFLKLINPNPTGNEKPVNVNVCMVPLIKRIPEGYLFVDFKLQIPENLPLATNKPEYLRARNNGHFCILSPFYAIHETWARNDQELWFKINNWGHSTEELEKKQTRLSYFNLWKSLDAYNYRYIHNFHPADPKVWPIIGYHAARNIDEFMETFLTPLFPLSPTKLYFRNTRFVGRVVQLYQNGF